MKRTTPELAIPSPNFRTAPAGGRMVTTHDIEYSRPYIWCIVSIDGLRAWTLRSRGLTIRLPRSPVIKFKTFSRTVNRNQNIKLVMNWIFHSTISEFLHRRAAQTSFSVFHVQFKSR
ncbi:hypothetical protein AVEN_248994-1 [Araneus ventricosus]|uniref:Uncharacterized protein n=1 Tax=Araneus ventricosus TaxID=182803 RepID=A0A4Y2GC94_ARAVE|nr:hypothetical protein AVEN_248994-1 [Araneus ventricosus]